MEQMSSRVVAVVAMQVMGSLLLVLVLCVVVALALALVWPNPFRRLLRRSAGRGRVGSSADVLPGVPALPSVWAAERGSGGMGGRVRSAPGNGVRIVPLEQLLQSAAAHLPIAAFASQSHNQKPAEH